MSENMINNEEAILTVIVCPNLRIARIFGNPLVDRYSNAPPKILTILVKTLGISIECERSCTWGFSSTKPDSIRPTLSRKNRLKSLNLNPKSNETNENGELKSESLENENFSKCPLLSQLEMQGDYSALSKDIQQCLNEFRAMEMKVEGLNDYGSADKLPETHEIREYSTTHIPKRIGIAFNTDPEELDNPEMKIYNPFLDGISDLHVANLYPSARHNSLNFIGGKMKASYLSAVCYVLKPSFTSKLFLAHLGLVSEYRQ
nr:hypothetical protein HmN_000854000 [Hymenolepis microstoma]